MIIESYKDKADNENAEVKYEEGTKAGQEFTIDKTEPEISVKYYINGSETSGISFLSNISKYFFPRNSRKH